MEREISPEINNWETRISQVESFDELYALFGEMDSQGATVKGTQKEYSGSELKAIIESVLGGSHRIDRLTRTAGLRDKVIELMRKQVSNGKRA